MKTQLQTKTLKRSPFALLALVAVCAVAPTANAAKSSVSAGLVVGSPVICPLTHPGRCGVPIGT